VEGLRASRVPLVGNNYGNVLGIVLSNFAFITTVPSWVNVKVRDFNATSSVALKEYSDPLLHLFSIYFFPPQFLNHKLSSFLQKKEVNIQQSVWVSTFSAMSIYLVFGLFGANIYLLFDFSFST